MDVVFTVLNNLVSTAKLLYLLSVPSYKILTAIGCAGEAVSGVTTSLFQKMGSCMVNEAGVCQEEKKILGVLLHIHLGRTLA